LRTFDVNHIPLLAAFDSVPREGFVPAGRESLAYSDQDVAVAQGSGERRFMLAPMVLARLIQSLEIGSGDKVLDVACGLGYSCAVMARLGAAVIGLDVDESIVAEARRRLAESGTVGAAVVGGALESGYPKGGPYDAILVNGAVETEPRGADGATPPTAVVSPAWKAGAGPGRHAPCSLGRRVRPPRPVRCGGSCAGGLPPGARLRVLTRPPGRWRKKATPGV
jgi:protein-L-isoaspartate O-methyltransferase